MTESGGQTTPKSTPAASILAPCTFDCDDLEDVDEQGKPVKKLAVKRGWQSPERVMRDVATHIIERNEKLLKTRQFHEGLLFRLGSSDELVTLRRDAKTGAISVAAMERQELTNAAIHRFCYLNHKADQHLETPGWLATDLSGRSRSRLPVLDAVIYHPAVRFRALPGAKQGSIEWQPGYDPVTKVWVAGQPVFDKKTKTWSDPGYTELQTRVPMRPTEAEVIAAVQTVREPLIDVIFKGDEINGQSPVKKPGVDMVSSEANTIGHLIGAMGAKQFRDIPYIAYTAPAIAVGKGLGNDINAMLITRRKAATTPLPENKTSDHMVETVIGKAIIERPHNLFVQFDEPSSDKPFFLRILAAMATDGGESDLRPAFQRKLMLADTRRIIAITGINIRPDKDMVRRFVVVEYASPDDLTLAQERVFKRPGRENKPQLLRWVDQNREDLLGALMTLVTNWQNKRCPEPDIRWDYADYVGAVGGIMQAAGIKTWFTNRYEVMANADEARLASFVRSLSELKASDGTALITGATSRQLAAAMISLQNTQGTGDRLSDQITWEPLGYARGVRDHLVGKNEDKLTGALGNWLKGIKGRVLTDYVSGKVRVNATRIGGGLDTWSFTVTTPAKAKKDVEPDDDEEMPEPPKQRAQGRPAKTTAAKPPAKRTLKRTSKTPAKRPPRKR